MHHTVRGQAFTCPLCINRRISTYPFSAPEVFSMLPHEPKRHIASFGQGFHPCTLTRAMPLTRLRCGGGFFSLRCGLLLTMGFHEITKQARGISRIFFSAPKVLSMLPHEPKRRIASGRQGFHPCTLTRAAPLTRLRCGGGFSLYYASSSPTMGCMKYQSERGDIPRSLGE